VPEGHIAVGVPARMREYHPLKTEENNAGEQNNQ
jgi:hypothetical protein